MRYILIFIQIWLLINQPFYHLLSVWWLPIGSAAVAWCDQHRLHGQRQVRHFCAVDVRCPLDGRMPSAHGRAALRDPNINYRFNMSGLLCDITCFGMVPYNLKWVVTEITTIHFLWLTITGCTKSLYQLLSLN